MSSVAAITSSSAQLSNEPSTSLSGTLRRRLELDIEMASGVTPSLTHPYSQLCGCHSPTYY